MVSADRLPEAEAEYLRAISVYERMARSHPDQVDCVAGLGNANANLGGILLDIGRREAGLERLARGVDLLEDVIRRFPQHTETKLFLGGVYFNRASLAKSEKRHAEALADWDRAIPLPRRAPLPGRGGDGPRHEPRPLERSRPGRC